MVKTFTRKRAKKTRRSYSYKPSGSLDAEERKVYRSVVFTIAIIVLIVVSLYLWGIKIVIGISDFWETYFPNTTTGINLEQVEKTLLPPRIDPLPLYMNTESLDIQGWGESGLDVALYINDTEVAQVLVDKNGRFEYAGVNLQSGENSIYGVTIDGDTASGSSQMQVVTVDLLNPTLTVEFDPINTEDATVVVRGETEDAVSLYINERRIIVQTDGTYSHTLLLNEGTNTYNFEAIDLAGNSTTIEKNIDYTPTDSAE